MAHISAWDLWNENPDLFAALFELCNGSSCVSQEKIHSLESMGFFRGGEPMFRDQILRDFVQTSEGEIERKMIYW